MKPSLLSLKSLKWSLCLILLLTLLVPAGPVFGAKAPGKDKKAKAEEKTAEDENNAVRSFGPRNVRLISCSSSMPPQASDSWHRLESLFP